MQMRLLTALAVLGTSVNSALAQSTTQVPYFSGFNFPATKPDGSCKTSEDWKKDFATVQSWSPGTKAKFNVAKIFSTVDCDGLNQAVPAALETGMKIWAGVWAVDDAKFDREKGGLEAAIKKYHPVSDWLTGVNVGSESLYRKEIAPWLLAKRIYDVKGMVQQAYKIKVPVGCADTWTSWVDSNNKDVIIASDVILMNAFPYWQGVAAKDGLTTFQKAISDTRNAIGSTKQIVIGETGWPSAGVTSGAPPADLKSLQSYYAATSCWLQSSGRYPWFWFSAFDQPERGANEIEGNFGLANKNKTPKVKTFKCPA